MKAKKFGVISLGCDKNRVDTEKAIAILSQKHILVSSIDDADIVIINTCAFLNSSRKEAIDEILQAIDLKNGKVIEKIIVTGCLPQKFVGELFSELKEVDAFLGVSDYSELNGVIERIYNGERVNAVGVPRSECGRKRVLSTEHYAYLKISDGCSNHCTYCLIPSIRGKFRSVEKADLIEETKGLGKLKELILVAQDLTRYGEDLTPKINLVSLIREISELENVEKIRLLYCYPEGITDELIDEMAKNDKIVKYIDIPMQHADDKVLKLMNRKGTGKGYLELIRKLREKVKGIAIRSTFITGFPQEDENAYENLKEFLAQAKLDNAGFFKYSREEGTPAYKLDGQVIESVKTKRLKGLYSLQKKVVKNVNKEKIGKTFSVLAEGFDFDQLVYYGRAYFNAPDVDGKVYFFSKDEVTFGEYVCVKITKTTDYDLYGERV